MERPPKKLGEILKDKGYVTDEMFAVAMTQQKITDQLLGVTLQKLGFVTPKEMAEVLAEQAGVPYVNLSEYHIAEELLRKIPRDMAERLECLPLSTEDGHVNIGLTNPNNIVALDTMRKLLKMQVKVNLVDSDSLNDSIERMYYFMENPIAQQIDNVIKEIVSVTVPQPASVSALTELIIKEGLRRAATDIHLSPSEETLHVFYRVDGVMHHAACVPKNAQNGIISKIKVLSNLDIAEQRLPQDGFFGFTFLKKNLDMRVSTLPTIYGENVVIRVLSGTGPVLRFDSLGFDENNTKKLKYLFNKPYGIILITGPTGSGKTTTLYSALRQIDLLGKNVLTVEDPVEYRLNFVRQTQVNLKSGYDFSRAGRTFMRQDPDVMLLGEIRDEETAHIAVRASITGHLVLSTLHTNDAVTAIPRLADLGVDKFNIAASVLGIVAQRLVRKICNNCKVKYTLDDGELEYFRQAGYGTGITEAYRGRGCLACQRSGYAGRTVVGEILILDDELRDMIAGGESVLYLKRKALEKAMKSMQANAIDKLSVGITSLEEILRVVG
ncbi:MAG: Flp pilus assembly complex ATPase component TadA [Nitrospirae bacterium YQR-1]